MGWVNTGHGYVRAEHISSVQVAAVTEAGDVGIRLHLIGGEKVWANWKPTDGYLTGLRPEDARRYIEEMIDPEAFAVDKSRFRREFESEMRREARLDD